MNYNEQNCNCFTLTQWQVNYLFKESDVTDVQFLMSSNVLKTIWAASSKKGAYGNLKNFCEVNSAFDYYVGIYWFCANTFENKMLQYFTETSESHIGYLQLWPHILRHLRHLLTLCWKSHKPPFRLAQLNILTRVVRRQRSSPRGNQIKIATFSECHSNFKVKVTRSKIMEWRERFCHKECTYAIWKPYR